MKALEIDETLAEAHAALGWIKMTCDWDWPGSEREFKRALEINPNYGTARNWHSAYFEAMGRLDEAIAERRRALEVEPLSLIMSASLGRALYVARKNDQAMEELRKTLDMDPSFVEAHLYLGWVYEQKGMFPEAIAELRAGIERFRRRSPIRERSRPCLRDFGAEEDGGGVPGPVKGAGEATVRGAVQLTWP